MRVQDLVEQALDLARLPSVVTVIERTEANLRWANNALITNGEMHSRTLTVTSTAEAPPAANIAHAGDAGADRRDFPAGLECSSRDRAEGVVGAFCISD